MTLLEIKDKIENIVIDNEIKKAKIIYHINKINKITERVNKSIERLNKSIERSNKCTNKIEIIIGLNIKTNNSNICIIRRIS